MQANWSLLINVLLLMGVVAAIVHLIKARKQEVDTHSYEIPKEESSRLFSIPPTEADDIISIRKVPQDFLEEESILSSKEQTPSLGNVEEEVIPDGNKARLDLNAPLMLLIQAKDQKSFAGYELLQTVLASGLRFGEGQLFHRHQFANGQGPVLCSLAAATASGVFDLQNIGAFSVRGLCLFMHASQNSNIDEERFTIMLDTARALSEGLDAKLLDFEQKPLTEERIARYYRVLQVERPAAIL